MILTATIDAAERREVAIVDIPNAFIQTRIKDKKDKAVLRLRGKLAELMVKVAPQIYRKHVIINRKGEMVLYVRILNAIYGIMKAALLFYQQLLRDLTSIGFVLNLYNPCVANKTIDGRDHPGLKRTAGHIGLLGHGRVVEFRNLKVQEISSK